MTLVTWKLLKYLGISLFSAGVLSTLLARDTKQQSLAAYWVTTFGFLLTWITGYGMMKSMGYKMSSPWITNSILGSMVTLGATLYSVGQYKLRPLLGSVALTTYTFSLVAMTFRSASCTSIFSTLLPVVAILSFLLLRRTNEGAVQDENPTQAAQESLSWFYWMARLEGASLLILLFVYMPLKYGAGINLDGGQGWFGWFHGIFQVIYIAGLLGTAKLNGWSLGRMFMGFVASLLPGGTFVFEHKLRQEKASPQ